MLFRKICKLEEKAESAFSKNLFAIPGQHIFGHRGLFDALHLIKVIIQKSCSGISLVEQDTIKMFIGLFEIHY